MRTMIENNTQFFHYSAKLSIISTNCKCFGGYWLPTKHKDGLDPYLKKSDFLVGTYYMI
jgi:hypothetical protein